MAFAYSKNLYNKEETAAEQLWEERWDAAGVGTKVEHSKTTLYYTRIRIPSDNTYIYVLCVMLLAWAPRYSTECPELDISTQRPQVCKVLDM